MWDKSLAGKSFEIAELRRFAFFIFGFPGTSRGLFAISLLRKGMYCACKFELHYHTIVLVLYVSTKHDQNPRPILPLLIVLGHELLGIGRHTGSDSRIIMGSPDSDMIWTRTPQPKLPNPFFGR